MWVLYALLGAFFASITAILAKIGLKGVNSNVAVAVRTVVVLIMAWVIVLINGKIKEVAEITQNGWVFLTLSGIATGLSWLFFYKALQMGDASVVVPIDKLSIVMTLALAFFVLKEPVDVKTIVATLLITSGMFVLILK